MRAFRSSSAVLALALGALAAPAACAQDLSLSGFGTLALGRSSGSCESNAAMASAYTGYCTRAIADWGHGGVYTPSTSAKPESRLGLQGQAKFDANFSATVQLTARSLEEQHLNLEWAYLTARLSPDWTLQLGRKRLPLYYYSDFQDIGFAYNTVRPSPDVYGWDVVNYNGASLAWSRDVGEWTLRAEALAGSENSKKNPYSRLVVDDPMDVKWSGITGLVLEFSRDWFSGRLSYTRSQFQQTDHNTGVVLATLSGKTRVNQSFLGAAFNADIGAWTLRSEVGRSDRAELGYKASFYLLTAGYRIGAYTLTAGTSQYRETTPYPADYVPVVDRGSLLALRYELHKGGALKLQYDRISDRGSSPFAGSARLLSASYDFVF
ncbi:porin [Roseateles microcysteis]|uniref:porin n=1 Tax=Roseateles microcysteis TaxID=3119057 RepID=UPI002FE611DF